MSPLLGLATENSSGAGCVEPPGAYHRMLKLARTIADLCGEDRIHTAHVAEAIQYRSRCGPR